MRRGLHTCLYCHSDSQYKGTTFGQSCIVWQHSFWVSICTAYSTGFVGCAACFAIGNTGNGKTKGKAGSEGCGFTDTSNSLSEYCKIIPRIAYLEPTMRSFEKKCVVSTIVCCRFSTQTNDEDHGRFLAKSPQTIHNRKNTKLQGDTNSFLQRTDKAHPRKNNQQTIMCELFSTIGP